MGKWNGLRTLAAAGAVAILAACGGLPPGTVPGTQSLSGQVKFNGQAPPQALTVHLRTASGTSQWQAIFNTTQTDSAGAFSFNNLAAGRYQPYYDDGGQISSDQGVNTAGVAVPDAVEVTSGGTAPSVSFDIAWTVNPNPAVNATVTVPYTFAWTPKPALPGAAEYQIFVKAYTPTSQQVGNDVWSSGWDTGNSVSWNGRVGTATDTPSGAMASPGNYVYQVKYRRAGGTFGGSDFFGQTKWIPFTLSA